MGVKRYIGTPVQLECKNCLGMPDNLFIGRSTERMTKIIRNVSSSQWNYLDHSHVHKLKVNSVPLKPHISYDDDPSLYQVLAESRDGLTDFFPQQITDLNIGSNDGLLRILKNLTDKRNISQQQNEPENLQVICVDCNIFMRILKVIKYVQIDGVS